MKLLYSSEDILELEFTQDEAILINQVLNVPLLAFGLDDFLLKTSLSKNQIETINNKFRDLSNIDSPLIVGNFKPAEIIILQNAFEIACEVIDQHEMQTLTGYSWEEAISLQKTLKTISSRIKATNKSDE